MSNIYYYYYSSSNYFLQYGIQKLALKHGYSWTPGFAHHNDFYILRKVVIICIHSKKLACCDLAGPFMQKYSTKALSIKDLVKLIKENK